jgi:fatty acid desaturase
MRVDRIQDRGNAEMQLGAARESFAESYGVVRLTWLATIFIPRTFMSGLFSMTEDVGSRKGTFKTYFAAAIPLAVCSLIAARWGSLIVQWLLHFSSWFTRKKSQPFQ